MAHAVGSAMRMPVAARGGVFPASGRTEALVAGARAAVADLVVVCRAASSSFSFTVPRMRPRQAAAELARHGVCAWDGDHYARELFDAIGVTESGGSVRLGLLHYNTVEEVDRLLDAVAVLGHAR